VSNMQTSFSNSDLVDIKNNKDLALSFLQSVQRDGINSLIKYLCNSDYFIAPASASYHDAFPGGLCHHSLNLFYAFDEANKKMSKPIPHDSVILCALLHDLCKIGAYKQTGKGYESVKGLKGHATLSISRINKCIKLTQQEEDIIRYHMALYGIFTYREHDTLAIFEAINKNPHVQIFAALDMLDSKRK
jgi:23S rRNA maturation-related 3'-5' exoribonuclease YhaM